MKILILTRKPKLLFNQEFTKVAKDRGVEVLIVDPLACEMILEGQKSKIYFNNKQINNIDFVIPRMGGAVLSYGLSIIRNFELIGVPILNCSSSLVNTINRFEYLQNLSMNSAIKTPKSALVKKSNQIQNALKYIDGPPAVLKMSSGVSNLGAILIDTPSTAESYLDIGMAMGTLGDISQSIMLEEYIKDANSMSNYLLVLNNKVIASYMRTKPFPKTKTLSILLKANIEYLEPKDKMIEMACEATKTLNLDFALVGILEGLKGPKVFEINPLCDLEYFEKNQIKNIMEKILDFTMSYSQPEVTIHG